MNDTVSHQRQRQLFIESADSAYEAMHRVRDIVHSGRDRWNRYLEGAIVTLFREISELRHYYENLEQG